MAENSHAQSKKPIHWAYMGIVAIAVIAPFTPITKIGWAVPIFYLILGSASLYVIWKWMTYEIENDVGGK